MGVPGGSIRDPGPSMHTPVGSWSIQSMAPEIIYFIHLEYYRHFFFLFRTGEFGIIWLFKQCLLTRKVLIVLSKTKMSFRFFPHLLSRISCKPQDLSISSVILTAASSIFLECSLFGYFFTFKIFFSFY